MSRTSGHRPASLIRGLCVAGAALLITAPAASAQAPTPEQCLAPAFDVSANTPEWTAREEFNRACGRLGTDLANSSPAFDAAFAKIAADPAHNDLLDKNDWDADPLRYPPFWNNKRGLFRKVKIKSTGGGGNLPAGTDGDLIGAQVFAPLPECIEGASQNCPAGVPTHPAPPYPGIVMTGGTNSNANQVASMAEILAEHGYVVTTDSYTWTSSSNVNALRANANFFFSTPEAPTANGEVNPFADLIDRSRVGIAGHSLGASSATTVGFTDARFDTVVLFDGGGGFNTTVRPTKPAIIMPSDTGVVGSAEVPRKTTNPSPTAKDNPYNQLKAAGHDTMVTTPRQSGHQDYAQTVIGIKPSTNAFWDPFPLGKQSLPYSYWGQAEIEYYVVAWVDRYVRGVTDTAARADGLRRLVAWKYDSSRDVNSIGTGRYNAAKAAAAGDVTAGNEPVMINGIETAERKSFYYLSRYWLNGGAAECTDMRRGRCDSFMPTTEASVAPQPNGSSLVTLAASDLASGVAKTEYSVDAGAWQTYSAPFSVGAGTRNIKYRSVDAAGNTESEQSLGLTSAGGTVAATLSVALGAPVTYGAFAPGVAQTYTSGTDATVTSTAGDATLSVADPSSTATGHLVNGTFALPSPLLARATKADTTGTAFNAVGSSASPLNLLTWNGPVSNDPVALQFRQVIGAGDGLRTGTYAKTLTFTLSTTTP
jgi:hypothetical protein